jgi:hypothetical protein
MTLQAISKNDVMTFLYGHLFGLQCGGSIYTVMVELYGNEIISNLVDRKAFFVALCTTFWVKEQTQNIKQLLYCRSLNSQNQHVSQGAKLYSLCSFYLTLHTHNTVTDGYKDKEERTISYNA